MAEADCGFKSRPDVLVLHGPTIRIQIGFDLGYHVGDKRAPDLPPDMRYALVDTGASESCIDSSLAIELDLPVVDRRSVSGSHGAQEVNFHLAQIYVPDLDHAIIGRFAGVHLAAGGQPHSALMGRTFLRNVTMIYEGRTGAVTLSND